MQMPDWVSILVAHLLRCRKTIEAVVDRVTPEDLQLVHGFTTSLLWTFSRDYYKKYNKVIPRSSLEAELVQYNSGGWALEMGLDEVVDFVEWVYAIKEEDFNWEEALSFTRKMLELSRLQAPIQRAAVEGYQSVEELASIVNSGIEQSSIGSAEVIDPLANVEKMLGGMPADPIGGAEVNYFNQLCQGGLRRGEIAVLLGPTGGFKTTMALDVCCAMANTQEHSMYITYEQPFADGDLGMRILARMAGIDKSRCESVPVSQMTPEEQKRVYDAQRRSHYIQFMDRTQGNDTVGDIGSFVAQQAREGRKPRLVVIDQLLQWISSWPEYSEDTKTAIARDVILRLRREVASKHGVAILVLHQLTAALVGGSSTKKPHHSDSAECKSVAFWADFGIALGNLNTDVNVLWAVASKTRRGSYTELLLQPSGGMCRLHLCKDYELSSGNSFVKKGGAANMVGNITLGGPQATVSGASVLGKGDL